MTTERRLQGFFISWARVLTRETTFQLAHSGHTTISGPSKLRQRLVQLLFWKAVVNAPAPTRGDDDALQRDS